MNFGFSHSFGNRLGADHRSYDFKSDDERATLTNYAIEGSLVWEALRRPYPLRFHHEEQLWTLADFGYPGDGSMVQ